VATQTKSNFNGGAFDVKLIFVPWPPTSFNPRRYPGLCAILGDEIVDPEHHSLADEAHDRILLKIIRGELTEGTELKTTKLSEMLGMSRTPVMQALSRLTADGIVSQALNQRATVRPGAENWLVDLHQVRQLLEPEAAACLCRAHPRRCPRRSGIARARRDAGQIVRLADVRRAGSTKSLHLVIAEYGGNLAMRAIIRRCWSYKRLSYEAGNDSDRHLREGWKQHAALVEAMREGISSRVSSLMEEHLRSAVAAGGRIV
jgi:DNA-binding GntR family transcriptional regulator